jgi:hypothetical protein
MVTGGRRGIRTHGGIAPSPVFKTGALNHSASLPEHQYIGWYVAPAMHPRRQPPTASVATAPGCAITSGYEMTEGNRSAAARPARRGLRYDKPCYSVRWQSARQPPRCPRHLRNSWARATPFERSRLFKKTGEAGTGADQRLMAPGHCRRPSVTCPIYLLSRRGAPGSQAMKPTH